MKSLLKILVLTFFIMCTSTLPLSAFHTFVSPDPTSTDSLGENFIININVDEESIEFRGYQLIFTYNDSIMNFVEAEEGALFAGQNIGWWMVEEESDTRVRIECSIFGAGLYVSGPGTVLNLTFEALQKDITEIIFFSVKFYDIDGYPITDVTSDDGTIIIGSATLPSPQDVKINLQNNNLLLAWDRVIGANGYKIFSSYSPYSGFDSIGAVQDTSFLITNPSETKHFFYIVGDTNLFGCE